MTSRKIIAVLIIVVSIVAFIGFMVACIGIAGTLTVFGMLTILVLFCLAIAWSMGVLIND